MAYEQNPNSGSLFRNEKKNAPNQPDYEGNALIGGKTYRIAAWIKDSKSGKKYMSLAFSEPQPPQYQQGGYAPQPQAPAPQYNPRGMQQTGVMPSAPLSDEDIPF